MYWSCYNMKYFVLCSFSLFILTIGYLSIEMQLHATLMNERHRKRNKSTRKLESFDARGIFYRYGSEEWGEYPICEAHLSQRFVYDENGYYHCCASIPFPDNMQAE
ncbi:hypothetical protein F511_31575 [Dorcoceras hygrometricum]|uniref:A-kinase anchor protein 7-like phosphoesterase domain-containing protein n=1 Tax=Dorcoceras hygrometricum TaxID=472368 RepID=A0A2Z7AP87_9LAMI|nr:hypothetical protein F511_31575 [Dorcoceras hygrometricum]